MGSNQTVRAVHGYSSWLGLAIVLRMTLSVYGAKIGSSAVSKISCESYRKIPSIVTDMSEQSDQGLHGLSLHQPFWMLNGIVKPNCIIFRTISLIILSGLIIFIYFFLFFFLIFYVCLFIISSSISFIFIIIIFIINYEFIIIIKLYLIIIK